mgnify:CR=1 FL=1
MVSKSVLFLQVNSESRNSGKRKENEDAADESLLPTGYLTYPLVRKPSFFGIHLHEDGHISPTILPAIQKR